MTRSEINSLLERSVLVYVGPIAVLLVVYSILHFAGFHKMLANDAEAIGAVLGVFGGIYAVVWAFTIFLIWTQFSLVENLVLQEVSSLDDLARFSGEFGDERVSISSAIRQYIYAATAEWPNLAQQSISIKAEEMFSDVTRKTFAVTPKNPKQEMFYARLLEVVDRANTFRDERVAVSIKRMPPTLLTVLDLLALAALLCMFVLPIQHWLVGVLLLGILACLFALARYVMTDMDNPFAGSWNVSPQPFKDLVRKL